jgi:hypothetical protein
LVKRQGHEFGYKAMDDSMQPFYYGCPEKILNQLTPTDDPGSNKWREQCWKKIGKNPYEKSKLPQQVALF